uniref:Uncharacterized protein n=1 Tax=Cacopsylla melanoneura TaxID=428564 RepID=A0A8D9EUB4_9HEMI
MFHWDDHSFIHFSREHHPNNNSEMLSLRTLTYSLNFPQKVQGKFVKVFKLGSFSTLQTSKFSLPKFSSLQKSKFFQPISTKIYLNKWLKESKKTTRNFLISTPTSNLTL